jgi:nickel/cobalt exporter
MADRKPRPARRLRFVTLLLAAALSTVLGLPAAPVAAHPLGNFTINRYSRLEISAGRITLRYVVDMAEIPTFQEMSLVDRNRDGQVDDGERAAYLAQRLTALSANLHLQLNRTPAVLAPAASALSFPPGQGGLPTLRIVADFAATVSAAPGAQSLDYRDDNFADRLGWKEIVIRAGEGVSLSQSTVASSDRSAELTRYPDDMLSSPLDIRQAHATFEATAVPAAAGQAPRSPLSQRDSLIDRSRDELAALIAAPELSLPLMLFSLLAAFGLGALHSLSPGHGKTVVGAYLVGSRGTARHALFLGLTVTLTHTLGVFALGLVTLFASQYVVPEQIYPWLSLVSGGMVAAIGLSLFASRLRSALKREAEHHHHGGEDHDHEHTHGHGHSHSHAPIGEAPLAWRNLLTLGISGGLLPCPSALVVLLGAIALHRVAFGLLLIVAFSAGLAGVLTAIGVLMVHAGRWFGRVRVPGRIVGLLPVGSSLVVTVLGLVLLAEALSQVGVRIF